MNLNFTLNNLPQIGMDQRMYPEESEEDDECVSIEHKISG
jgi:hypothetical protein